MAAGAVLACIQSGRAVMSRVMLAGIQSSRTVMSRVMLGKARRIKAVAADIMLRTARRTAVADAMLHDAVVCDSCAGEAMVRIACAGSVMRRHVRRDVNVFGRARRMRGNRMRDFLVPIVMRDEGHVVADRRMRGRR